MPCLTCSADIFSNDVCACETLPFLCKFRLPFLSTHWNCIRMQSTRMRCYTYIWVFIITWERFTNIKKSFKRKCLQSVALLSDKDVWLTASLSQMPHDPLHSYNHEHIMFQYTLAESHGFRVKSNNSSSA